MNQPGYASEIDAMHDLRRRGYTADFEVRDGVLHEIASGRRFVPGELTIVEHHRFEGASNPEDMSVVYALESSDGVRGIVVDAFGVYANPRLADFLQNVTMHERA